MNELEAEYKMSHLMAENETLKQRLASFEERITETYKMQDRYAIFAESIALPLLTQVLAQPRAGGAARRCAQGQGCLRAGRGALR